MHIPIGELLYSYAFMGSALPTGLYKCNECLVDTICTTYCYSLTEKHDLIR